MCRLNSSEGTEIKPESEFISTGIKIYGKVEVSIFHKHVIAFKKFLLEILSWGPSLHLLRYATCFKQLGADYSSDMFKLGLTTRDKNMD